MSDVDLALLPNKLIERDGFTLSYCDIGDPHDPPLVFCHGLAASGRQFSLDAQFFADQGYRVILPDLRGHGRSIPALNYSQDDFSIACMSDDLLAIFDEAGADRVHYVGNSLGGILALKLLAHHGHRFASFCTFGTSYALSAPYLSANVVPKIHEFVGTEWVDALLARGTSSDPAAQQLVRQILADYDIRIVDMVARNVREYDFIANAQDYDGPILMLRGDKDHLVNIALSSTLAKMKHHHNFALLDLPAGGHCANLDANEEFRIALLGFITQHRI